MQLAYYSSSSHHVDLHDINDYEAQTLTRGH